MIDKNLKLKYYLTNIYGIGSSKANKLAIYIGANPNTKYQKLNNNKKDILNKVLTFYLKSKEQNAIGDNLKQFILEQKLNKLKINSLKAKRHKLKLPTRGQRTRTNGRSAKRLNHLGREREA